MKFYGIDLHSDSFMAGVLDEKNEQKKFKCSLKTKAHEVFLEELTKEDYVVIEASTNTFWFYDQIKSRVKECYVVNPHKIKVISESTNKTDKRDAITLARLLKYATLAGDKETDLPVVYVPEEKVRVIRALFTTYKMFRKHSVSVKNRIYSLLKQNGYCLKKDEVFGKVKRKEILKLDLSKGTLFQLELLYQEIEHREKQIKKVKEEILKEGSFFKKEIAILTSIRGISPFIAVAVMADIVDIKRFKNAKNLCSYLRAAPTVDSSNKVTKIGKVNKQSRDLTMSLLPEIVLHLRKSSKKYEAFYQKKAKGKSKGKVRVAILRKIIVAMYNMLKKEELYYYRDKKNHLSKLASYQRFLINKGFEESLLDIA